MSDEQPLRIEQRASASGALSELKKLGAIEGVHYRITPADEDLTKYVVAFDAGPMVKVMKFDQGKEFTRASDFPGFAVVTADCMEKIGCAGIAGLMRDGTLPAEVVYLYAADE